MKTFALVYGQIIIKRNNFRAGAENKADRKRGFAGKTSGNRELFKIAPLNIKLYPFSFREFLLLKGKKITKHDLLETGKRADFKKNLEVFKFLCGKSLKK